MRKKSEIKISGMICVAFIWLIISIFVWIWPEKEISESERRLLEQFPELTAQDVLSGDFAKDFETYTLDQFPMRDVFRQVKSLFHYYVLQQKDINNVYIYDGYAAKMEYPLNQASLEYSVKKFNGVYENYLKGANARVYMSIVPDKGYYMAEESGHIVLDYEMMFAFIQNIEWAEYIDVTGELSVSSYYRTDTHWRQEKILQVAQKLCKDMNVLVPDAEEFVVEQVNKPFYGVYCGQAALPMLPDNMYIAISNYTESSKVFDYEISRSISVYNDDAVNNKDLYDTYLHGAKALLKIENSAAETDRELIIFRDSFGSSIAPLMLKGYKSITLVDLRYINGDLLKSYIDFKDKDVLFLYSTLVLNNSFSIK